MKIGCEIKTLSHLIRREFEGSEVFRSVESLTGTHGYFLGYLAHHSDRDVFQRDLEREFSIRRSTATGILNLMEKNGLIIRQAVPDDARLKKLVLTEKAKTLHSAIETELDAIDAKILGALSEEEQTELFRLFSKLKRNLGERG